MSESTDLIRELIEGGLNYADIGGALGRNRSLIRQVGIGAKPGNNLREALAELRERLAGGGDITYMRTHESVTAPPRRQTAEGRPARTRRRQAYAGEHYTTTLTKQQGARGGARAAGRVLAGVPDHHRVVVTATFTKAVKVHKSYSKHATGAAELDLGDAAYVRAELAASGESLAEYAVRRLVEAGTISPANASQLVSLEVRTFEP